MRALWKAKKRLAKILKTKNDYQQALTEFDKLIRAVLTHQKAPVFQLEIAQCYTLLHQYQQADLEFETLIERYPDFEKDGRSFLRKPTTTTLRASMTSLGKIIKRSSPILSAQNFEWKPFWTGSLTYEELDDFDKAKKYYEEVRNEYPSPRSSISDSQAEKRKANKNVKQPLDISRNFTI